MRDSGSSKCEIINGRKRKPSLAFSRCFAVKLDYARHRVSRIKAFTFPTINYTERLVN